MSCGCGCSRRVRTSRRCSGRAWARGRCGCGGRPYGRGATLVDLYEVEAGSLGVRPEELPEADRVRLSMMTRPLRRAGLAVVPGSDRRGDRPGQCPALATASMTAR
jgi:hypothetical protein